MKLHFVLADTYRTCMAIVHENEYVPYRKRIVTIELTPEQVEAVKPMYVGHHNEKGWYEELLEVIPEK